MTIARKSPQARAHSRSGVGLRILRPLAARLCLLFMLLATVGVRVRAQTIEDGIMLPKKTLCAGALYTHDSWDRYWEGSLERTNGNIGTITTQTITTSANYGLIDRLNLIVSVPYVWTHASQGVLHGQSGYQDITLAAKVNAFQYRIRQFADLRAIGVVSGALPLTDYTPDLQPLSLGTHSKRIAARATLNYHDRHGLYVNGTTAYTWRGNVKLDRSSYYTNGQLYLTDEVAMPNVFDYAVSVGYRKRDLMLTGDFSQQQARGGGDIRRQDLPFVSNRTNFSKAGATFVYPIPKMNNFQYRFSYSNIFDGRNVGQANTFTTGLMYFFPFEKGATR